MSFKCSKDAIAKMYSSLDLERKIVGVKFLFTEDEYNKTAENPLKGGMYYCAMVKAAMSGRAIKATVKHFKCPASAKALGMVEPDELCRSGRHYKNLGLFSDLCVAKSVRNEVTFCNHHAYGVVIKPLETFSDSPDVVIIATIPYYAMRIIQGYTYVFGTQKAFKMTGCQGICSECTAYPYESNNINISMLCSGTRFFAKWRKDEVAIGMPFNKFCDVADGVFSTINAVEMQNEKVKIAKKLKDNNITEIEIDLKRTYFYSKK